MSEAHHGGHGGPSIESKVFSHDMPEALRVAYSAMFFTALLVPLDVLQIGSSDSHGRPADHH